MADGSIRIGTKLDTKPTEADLKKLEKECEKTAQKIEQAGAKIKTVFTGASKGQLNSAFKTANKELEKTEAALAAVEDKIRAIQSETDKKLPLAATDEQASNLLDMEAQETAPLLQQRDELTAKAAEYKQLMEAITAELNEQTQAEEAQKALKISGKQAAGDTEWLAKIKTQEQYNSALSTTQAKMAAIERQAEEISRETGVAKDKLLQQDAEYQKLSRRLSLLTSQTKKFGDAGANAGKKTSKEMSKTTKSVNLFGSALKAGIVKAGKLALAVFGIRAAYNAVRRAADAYLQGNEQLKQQLDSLWSVAGQAIGPFVEAMVNGISIVIAWVNSLIKALTGVDLIAKANAAALKKQANATKEAAKAAQQAGFDEINKLSDNTSSSGDTVTTFDTSYTDKIPNFLEEIKKKLVAGDFFGAGETLGDAFMKWINGVDWNSLGQTLGEIIMGVFGFALGFATQMEPMAVIIWAKQLLTGFYQGLSEGIQNLDWFEIGKKITDFVLLGLITSNPVGAILTFLLSPGTEELFSAGAEYAGSVVGALAAAFLGMVQRIGEIGKNIWTTIKTYFVDNIDWSGTPGEIINGLWEGIKEAFKGAGEWIKNNLWVPFRDGFKKAFGIKDGESSEAYEFGSNIVTGIKNGIGNIWTKVSSAFTSLKAKLSLWGVTFKATARSTGEKFAEGFKNGFEKIKEFVKKPINAVIGFFESAINWIIRQLNKLSWDIPDWVPLIGGETFGFDISEVSIPRLAKGGIVNNPGKGVPAVVGEAGAEAVLPLENNTGWMDILAEKINGGAAKIVVPIYLNGRKIAEEIIDLNQKRNFATNGAF